jgi:hypothetical protein
MSANKLPFIDKGAHMINASQDLTFHKFRTGLSSHNHCICILSLRPTFIYLRTEWRAW